MLCLTRKEGEKIELSGGIVVTLVYAKNGHAKIGIEAPNNITIDREEVAQAKRDAATVQRYRDDRIRKMTAKDTGEDMRPG